MLLTMNVATRACDTDPVDAIATSATTAVRMTLSECMGRSSFRNALSDQTFASQLRLESKRSTPFPSAKFWVITLPWLSSRIRCPPRLVVRGAGAPRDHVAVSVSDEDPEAVRADVDAVDHTARAEERDAGRVFRREHAADRDPIGACDADARPVVAIDVRV